MRAVLAISPAHPGTCRRRGAEREIRRTARSRRPSRDPNGGHRGEARGEWHRNRAYRGLGHSTSRQWAARVRGARAQESRRRGSASPTTTPPAPGAAPAPWATVLDAVVWFHRAAPGRGRAAAAPRCAGGAALPVTVGALIRYRETPVGPYREVLASPVAARRPARAGGVRAVHRGRLARVGPRRARELGAAEDARALRVARAAARRLRARRGGERLVGPRHRPPARRGGSRSPRISRNRQVTPAGAEITFDSRWRGRARLASVELETRGPTLPGWLCSGHHPALVLDGARLRGRACRARVARAEGSMTRRTWGGGVRSAPATPGRHRHRRRARSRSARASATPHWHAQCGRAESR